jgi:SAM-dependent methyltransferase
LLPDVIADEEEKLRESAGWEQLLKERLTDGDEAFRLGLPFSSAEQYFQHAAQELAFTHRLLGPLAGKSGLDLGGSVGWAAYSFAELGATMALADFNEGLSGLRGAGIYMERQPTIGRYRVDAHRLPFAAESFDFVFSCSFLHHMHHPAEVIREVGRVLKPGGVYVAACEAFCPSWRRPADVLTESETVREFLGKGINEQVFYQGEYLRWMVAARLRPAIFNPRWDRARADGKVDRGRELRVRNYRPEILAKRTKGHRARSFLCRALLHSGAWRLGIPLLSRSNSGRQFFLGLTQKHRLLVGRKDA